MLKNVRLQLAVIDTEEPGYGGGDCGDTEFFEEHVVFDGLFDVSAGGSGKDTVSGDFMIPFPPNGNANLCARAADDGAPTNYAAFASVQDVNPLNVINFIPPDAFFDFEHFAPIDFDDSCEIKVLVEDFDGNPLQNIPVTLLDPFIDPDVNGSANAVVTDENGLMQIGEFTNLGPGAGLLPSAFYVIDVNVDEFDLPVPINPDFGESFPDRFVSCAADAIGGIVTIQSQLPQFGGEGFEGGSIGLHVENISTGEAISGITVTITGTDFFGDAIVFDGVEDVRTTDSFGQTEFEGLDSNLDGLPGGDYTITFAGGGGLQSATTTVFVPSGFGGFIGAFLQISPE